MGADALIIEVHNNPSRALCDGVQSQTPAMFAEMMKKLEAIKPHAWKRA
jgi:3-deoxy-7-phosphoheptulonate synthase